MQTLKDPVLNMLNNLYEEDIPLCKYRLSFLDILIYHMHIKREMEHAEIAKVLKLSISSIQKRLTRFDNVVRTFNALKLQSPT